MAEPHVEVRAALVHVPVVAVLALVAPLLDEVLADLQVVAEVTSFPIWALPLALILLTSLDLALVVRVRARLALPALAMDELLADPVGGELRRIVGGSRSSCSLTVHACLICAMVHLGPHHLPHGVIIAVGVSIRIRHPSLIISIQFKSLLFIKSHSSG